GTQARNPRLRLPGGRRVSAASSCKERSEGGTPLARTAAIDIGFGTAIRPHRTQARLAPQPCPLVLRLVRVHLLKRRHRPRRLHPPIGPEALLHAGPGLIG